MKTTQFNWVHDVANNTWTLSYPEQTFVIRHDDATFSPHWYVDDSCGGSWGDFGTPAQAKAQVEHDILEAEKRKGERQEAINQAQGLLPDGWHRQESYEKIDKFEWRWVVVLDPEREIHRGNRRVDAWSIKCAQAEVELSGKQFAEMGLANTYETKEEAFQVIEKFCYHLEKVAPLYRIVSTLQTLTDEMPDAIRVVTPKQGNPFIEIKLIGNRTFKFWGGKDQAWHGVRVSSDEKQQWSVQLREWGGSREAEKAIAEKIVDVIGQAQ